MLTLAAVWCIHHFGLVCLDTPGLPPGAPTVDQFCQKAERQMVDAQTYAQQNGTKDPDGTVARFQAADKAMQDNCGS